MFRQIVTFSDYFYVTSNELPMWGEHVKPIVVVIMLFLMTLSKVQ